MYTAAICYFSLLGHPADGVVAQFNQFDTTEIVPIVSAILHKTFEHAHIQALHEN